MYRNVIATAVSSVVLAGSAYAQGDVSPVEVVYTVDGMDAVRVERGIEFARVDDRDLRFDAYHPDEEPPDRGWPAIVFVSGGESARDWGWFPSYGRLAAAHGLVGLIPDKRYPGGFEGLRQGYDDTARFLAYLRTHAAELNVDPDRVCVWAFSAGGLLASVALHRDGLRTRCLVVYYGTLDATEVLGDRLGRDSLEVKYSPVEAIWKLGADVPPTLIVRAGRDDEILKVMASTFATVALAANADFTLINYAEGDHGFDVLNDTARSREILRRTFQFIVARTAMPKEEPR